MGNFQCFPIYENNKLPSHMFKVKNIDDSGTEVGRGLIEVNKNDLVFYQRGHDPIRWPLMSLRRYGFDTQLFSFESGRRCATGPGLYAFKCKKGEHLFNLVKENAQHCGEEARNTSRTSAESVWTHPRSRPPSANGSLPRANGTILHHSPISIRSTHSHSSPHSSNNSPTPATPVYQNGDVVALKPSGLAPVVQYVNTVDIPEIELAPTSISFTVPQTPNTTTTTNNNIHTAIEADYDSSNYIDDCLVNYASLNLNRDEEVQITEQQVPQNIVTRDENGNKPTEQDQESVDSDMKLLDSKSDISEDDVTNSNIELGQELNRNGNASTDESSSEMTVQDEQDGNMNVTSSPTHTPSSPTHTPKDTTPTRTSPGAYYANLDTVGELPQHYNFTCYSDLRTPHSTSSWSSIGSEFTFEPNNGANRSRSPSEHSYANLDTLTELGHASGTNSRHRTSSSPNMVLQPPPKGRVNYIELDMETLGALAKRPATASRQTRSYSVTSSPPKTPLSINGGDRTESYATIDFDRTNALASTNSTSTLPPNGAGGRRTRHDSRTT
ncbi:uncharacterized protein [Amphiura filiformis]|uniref:uncharacterized protein n=1 Tax=Amphiura filiformis TaxID=82378 RepID=UPI003B211581